jgi:phosphoribosylformylglycinamidine synthase
MTVAVAAKKTSDLAAEYGLKPDEYALILERLGREPNLVELGVFSVMWSEHCSYKSSRAHLRKLPTSWAASCATSSPWERVRWRS